MKNRTLLIAFVAFAHTLSAQTCVNPTAQYNLRGNNMHAMLLNGGDLFWDLNNPVFVHDETTDHPNPSTIFSAGLWVSGWSMDNHLKLAAVEYRNNGKTDYFAGPLSPSGTADVAGCQDWDRIFSASGTQIASFLQNLPFLTNNLANALIVYKEIMGWPGRGNPYFSTVWGFDMPIPLQQMAPFHDSDGDGVYNPLKGDYPEVRLQTGAHFVPAFMAWCVFNDQGAGAPHQASGGSPLTIEVQMTAWESACPNEPVVNNTVFTSHKIIYRGAETLQSVYAGFFVDLDLGCPWDDYMGVNPALNAFYAYNQDAIDGQVGAACDGGFVTYGNAPPVQSVTFLNHSLDKFNVMNLGNIIYPIATYTPTSPMAYYNFLSGKWADGTPIHKSGNGYKTTGDTTSYIYPADPANPNGWSMCTTNAPAADRATIGSHQIGEMLPGQIEELVTAWTYHPNTYVPCGLGNTFAEITSLHNLFDSQFAGLCSPVTATAEVSKGACSIAPNPASQSITISYPDLEVLEIKVIAQDGRVVKWIHHPDANGVALPVADLAQGVYVVQVNTARGMWTDRVMVAR